MTIPGDVKLAAAPLFIDLDGTLIRTDLLLESLLLLVKQQRRCLFWLPFWLLGGKARLKREVAARVKLDVTTLPYREELVTFLQGERRAGRRLILATAADEGVAAQVAAHIGLFDQVIASDGVVNTSGAAKLRALQQACPDRAFVYAGDARVDLKVWRGATAAVVIGEKLAAEVERVTPLERVFASGWRPGRVLSAMRLHQWVKNLLIVVPLFLAHELSAPLVLAAALAFLSFGLCASAVYLLNDMLDLEADRRHPRKRLRPFASGDLPLKVGFALTPLLLLGSVLVALALPPAFLGVLAGYFVVTTAYSLLFKRLAMLDVIVLALLYTVRIVAGAVAMGLELTPWLLAFSLFFFLNLAFVKRFAELHALRSSAEADTRANAGADAGINTGAGNAEKTIAGRGYGVEDVEGLANLGAASGYVSVLVVALYINSPAVSELYRAPALLWLLCPLLLYWISRVWLLARRGQMHDDPVVFALRDRTSYIIGALALAVGVAATWSTWL